MRSPHVLIKYNFWGKMEIKMLSSFSIFYPITGSVYAYNRVDAENQFIASARNQATHLHPNHQDVNVIIETVKLEGTENADNSGN